MKFDGWQGHIDSLKNPIPAAESIFAAEIHLTTPKIMHLSKFTHTCLVSTLLLVSSSLGSAATIVWSFNSDSAVVTSNGLSGSGVTTNNVTFSTNGGNTASIGGDLITGATTGGRAQRDLGSGQQATNESSFTFTINVGATAISLTDLGFLTGIDVNNGSANTNHTRWNVAISRVGASATTSSFVDSFPGGVGTFSTASKSTELSGLNLLQNESVTFTFTGRYGTAEDFSGGSNTQRWSFIDDVTFTAVEGIPEPSATALLGGLGALCLLRRRRA